MKAKYCIINISPTWGFPVHIWDFDNIQLFIYDYFWNEFELTEEILRAIFKNFMKFH